MICFLSFGNRTEKDADMFPNGAYARSTQPGGLGKVLYD